ncbi:MAG: cupin domain-containing protein [Sphingosinicella sp.]|nr:cupin domain-containing protein [Sphingosinicella sp.]
MTLYDFDPAAFLREYWQKKVALIRNPWGSWTNPLAPDELAGLACEEEVESRLIMRGPGGWTLEHGPFEEARFEQLPAKDWTLLVQAVDHHVPEVAALIDPFRFIPNWRIDDVMVSYASDGGSAGPHFDQYDVFLIQGLGKRKWQIGGRCDDSSEILPDQDMRLLAKFEAEEEWVLEAGDILYVPPGIAHYGMAVGDDCMTYSVGFRSPSTSDLVAGWTEHLLARLPEDERYRDPDLTIQENPGEIAKSAIARLHMMMTERMTDKQGFARWFGEYSSHPKYPDVDWSPARSVGVDEVRDSIARAVPLVRSPASRYSYLPQTDDLILLFVDGQSFECGGESAAFARRLCAQVRIHLDPDLAQSAAILELVEILVNQGSVAFDEEAGE